MNKICKMLCLFLLIESVIIGCKSQSYGSSRLLQNSYLELSEKDQNCLAWRFYLMAALDSMVKQATLHHKSRKRQEKYQATGEYQPPISETIVEEILPAKTANKIIDTIITKEGGHCSRELLYETLCIQHSHRGSGSTFGLGGTVKYEYFSSILGITLTPDNLDEFDYFLKEHLSKSPNSESSFYGFYCMMSTCPEKDYTGSNVFSFCILKKHKKYLMKHDLFDFDFYNYGEKYGFIKQDKESFESFVKRSNEIAAEAAKSRRAR